MIAITSNIGQTPSSRSAIFVKSAGCVGRDAAAGPSPVPAAPWQTAQLVAKRSLPDRSDPDGSVSGLQPTKNKITSRSGVTERETMFARSFDNAAPPCDPVLVPGSITDILAWEPIGPKNAMNTNRFARTASSSCRRVAKASYPWVTICSQGCAIHSSSPQPRHERPK